MQTSLQQHMNQKHKTTVSFPVGHPDRVKNKNSKSPKIACVQCDKRFSTGAKIEKHMKEHTGSNHSNSEFESPIKEKIRRYFKNGFCMKGEQCIYKHQRMSANFTPACNRGPGCSFLLQNRCSFFHPGVGVQMPRDKEDKNKQEYRFRENCLFVCTSTRNRVFVL